MISVAAHPGYTATNLTAKNLRAEADYFSRPGTQSFERPYGWAWLLKLAEELHGWDDPDGKEWAKNLQPLADVIKRHRGEASDVTTNFNSLNSIDRAALLKFLSSL